MNDSFLAQERVLIVEIRTPHGRRLAYPLSELAIKFCELLGQRSLAERDIERIKELGFVVKTMEEIL